jgi:oxygen-independent coproporphyrinogen III oxidase
MQSLGLYLSVPFCRGKCTYCNFASGVSSPAVHDEYVACLCEEIRSIRKRLKTAALPETIDSIYLGGGTPSLLAPRLVREIAGTLRQEFRVAANAEITLECAPGQLDDHSLEAALDLGVNRISFGVQSLVDREAAATGRFHTRAVVLDDLERVRAAGVRRLNIDVIAGMPHQTEESWQESLQTLVATGVDHASVYMLEVDEDSRLGSELLIQGSRYHARAVPGEALIAKLYQQARAFLIDHGFGHYEISNFARPECESRHNRKYWLRQPYLGFGLDAHSMVWTEDGTALRFGNPGHLPEYLASPGRVELRRLSREEEREEIWFLGLRQMEGVRWETVEDPEVFRAVVDDLHELGLLVEEEGTVRLTEQGVLFSNEVFERFLGVEQPACVPISPPGCQ